MSDTHLRWLAPAALCTAAVAAQAQGPTHAATPAARPDPLDATASVPTLNYRSAFAGYRGLGDDKRLPWREANEAVARIGGWRAYAREAQQPADAANDGGRPTPMPMPLPQGHSGHKAP